MTSFADSATFTIHLQNHLCSGMCAAALQSYQIEAGPFVRVGHQL